MNKSNQKTKMLAHEQTTNLHAWRVKVTEGQFSYHDIAGGLEQGLAQTLVARWLTDQILLDGV